MVLVGHSYVLLGINAPTLAGDPIHTIGVKLFFIISGYLITGSWRADPCFWRYAEKRARRIMPALLVVVFATVFVLGPVVTVDPRYWISPTTWTYLWRNSLLLPFHDLPGVFSDNPSPGVNGSLWTLPVEAAMYVVTPLLVRAGPWACLAAAVAIWTFPLTGEVAGFGLTGASSVVPFFLIGAAARMLGFNMPDIAVPALPADISYGIYLLAFPTQQTIIAAGYVISPESLALATAAVVAPLAWLSWTLIERPAMHTRWPMTFAKA